jgi:hypothetical protein
VVADVDLEGGEVARRDVRRIRGDEIEARRARSGGEEVPLAPRDVVGAEAEGVVARDGERVGADVTADERRRGALAAEGDGDAAAAGAEVERPQRHGAIAGAGEGDVDESLRVGARDEDAAVDVEGAPVELALAEDVGDRLARAAAAHHLAHPGQLVGREGSLRVDDELDARRAERARQEHLRVEARALDAARAEVVHRPAEERLDGPEGRGLIGHARRRPHGF